MNSIRVHCTCRLHRVSRLLHPYTRRWAMHCSGDGQRMWRLALQRAIAVTRCGVRTKNGTCYGPNHNEGDVLRSYGQWKWRFRPNAAQWSPMVVQWRMTVTRSGPNHTATPCSHMDYQCDALQSNAQRMWSSWITNAMRCLQMQNKCDALWSHGQRTWRVILLLTTNATHWSAMD